MSFGFGVGDFIAVLDKAKLYRERFADAPDHFDSLSREIESLASILEYIGSVEEQLEDTEKEQLAPAIKESVKLLGELEKIHNENTSLDRSLSTTKLAALKPRAIWSRLRLKPEDVQKLRLRISLNVAFLGAIKGFRDSEAIHATKRVVVSMHDDQSSRQRREILDWLTMTDYASQQRDHLSRRHAGTNEWLLDSEEFKSWISGKSKTLLCPGMPGAGKTVMASTVVDELLRQFQDDPDVGVAYIYCNFKDQERQNHHDLIASLAKQLAQSRSSMPRSLKEMYEIHQMSRTPMSLQETSDLLQAIASSYRRLFVIIDALDECETKSRRALLSEVFRLQQRQNTNILATTRQIPEIIDSDHFKGSVSVQVSALDADVSRYISSRIPDMQSFVQKRSELQEEIKRGILGSINGM
ncbi:ankyrin repeat protein [Colletotrichum karsti]|uniref:Ankyrin repeat protein n=1 Tax=Colletotrichum karsti TaxID=1095194 RepID=A0A9P6LNM9_9PEZI|nr:ankyrin repeat protein [Colletotrichum karsti]KAF9879391.1 ankyrin repeat protein [Colletotrichum karsti]